MKAASSVSSPGSHSHCPKGFALIVTLALMVLLLVIVVGLMTLSSVSLRGSERAHASAQARANARLAIQFAIGDLQRYLGPDRAVTAPSDLFGAEAKPGWVGVWDSWAADPSGAAPEYESEKSSRFRAWLASSADPSSMRRFTEGTGGFSGDTVPLISSSAPGSEAVGEVRAGRVIVDGHGGAFAWHVSDESMKARIDMARDPSDAAGLSARRALVAGHRTGIRTVSAGTEGGFGFLPADHTVEAFQGAEVSLASLVGLGQTDLMAGKRISNVYRHDVTTCSLGVLANVRDGGLKRDLSAAFEATAGLPAELTGRKLYQSTHGITGVSDPYWSALSAYYNSYKQARGIEVLPSYKLESAEAAQLDRQMVPRGYTVAPVIAKFEVIFTVVVRDMHGPWVADLPKATGDPLKKYMLHLVYLPIVTLHNPYNAEIEFERLTLVVRDVPAAFNFHVNGKPQNNRLVPFNEMFVVNSVGVEGEKAFMLDLGNWSSPAETKPKNNLKMKPGQTLVCGPYLDPSFTSAQTLRGSAGTKDRFSDNDTTAAIKLRPGFAGKAVGIGVDWLSPPEFDAGQSTDGKLGIVGLRLDDKVRIESGVRRPMRGVQDSWELSATLYVKNKPISYGGMLFQYEDDETLQKHFSKTHSFPVDSTIMASELYEPYNKTLATQVRSRAVVDFSAASRTANGGVFETNSRDENAGALNTLRDGRLAGKPFLHHNPARISLQVNLKKDLPGRFSHELNFQPLKGELDDMLELDAANRGPSLTGSTTAKGIKSGALFDLPSGPLQTLAGFRRSNALSSTYLPSFLQPIANSAVSPLMTTSAARQTGVVEYSLLDHSYLANQALYDGYYFSTFARTGGRAGDQVFADFVSGRESLAMQCFVPWLPAGVDPVSEAGRLFSGGVPTPNTWRESAAWQMVKGSFNVNSTRLLAWKAMLSSLSDTEIPVLWAKSLGLEARPGGKAPIAAMSMPIAGLATESIIDPVKIDDRRTNEWNGYRTLDDAQLDALARRIIEEVRERGPFLSMSDFVNRRLGPSSPLTRGGALHEAISKSQVNDSVFAQMIPVREKDVVDPAIYGYATPEAATGNPAEGAPGWITQGDLLHVLEPRATVRGDTFVIRACGQALDGDGKVEARAYAEAVVQRCPAYVDPTDEPVTEPSDLGGVNSRFGRKLDVVSFRWLTPDEI